MTQTLHIDGPRGTLETVVDEPEGAAGDAPVAVIAHPHPLFGGTLHNKVVFTLMQAFTACGFAAVRFNFRGVGASAGAFDEGRGEIEDMLAVIEHFAPSPRRLAVAGFSFGAFVATQAAARLHRQGREVCAVVLAATAVTRFDAAPTDPAWRERTLLLHGAQDDVVPLDAVLAWAAPQNLPVTVLPESGHFFHGRLAVLRSSAERHLRAVV